VGGRDGGKEEAKKKEEASISLRRGAAQVRAGPLGPGRHLLRPPAPGLRPSQALRLAPPPAAAPLPPRPGTGPLPAPLRRLRRFAAASNPAAAAGDPFAAAAAAGEHSGGVRRCRRRGGAVGRLGGVESPWSRAAKRVCGPVVWKRAAASSATAGGSCIPPSSVVVYTQDREPGVSGSETHSGVIPLVSLLECGHNPLG
jgi:hypothetical protein